MAPRRKQKDQKKIEKKVSPEELDDLSARIAGLKGKDGVKITTAPDKLPLKKLDASIEKDGVVTDTELEMAKLNADIRKFKRRIATQPYVIVNGVNLDWTIDWALRYREAYQEAATAAGRDLPFCRNNMVIRVEYGTQQGLCFKFGPIGGKAHVEFMIAPEVKFRHPGKGPINLQGEGCVRMPHDNGMLLLVFGPSKPDQYTEELAKKLGTEHFQMDLEAMTKK